MEIHFFSSLRSVGHALNLMWHVPVVPAMLGPVIVAPAAIWWVWGAFPPARVRRMPGFFTWELFMKRFAVNKSKSASQFRSNVHKTKAANVAVGPMRGGWRL